MPHSLKCKIKHLCHNGTITESERDRILKALDQEPKTGNWITHPKGIYAHLICNKCLSNAPYDCQTNYCPNCGAKMIESEEKENGRKN